MLSTPQNYFLRKPVYLTDPHSWIPHIPFAFFLVETMKPKAIVELGTYSGNSYFAFCQAVKDLQLPTKCVAVDTWQGDMHVGKYGKEVFKRVNEINEKAFTTFSKLLQMSFDDALPFFQDSSIDLLHIDGTHTYEAVKNDFANWLPKVSECGVILLHDTIVRKNDFGVWKFLKEVKERHRLLEFPFSEGLALVCKGEHTYPAIVNFIKQAKKDAMVCKFFESLGTNILMEREKDLFRKEVLRMRKKVAWLNSQLLELRKEDKWLRKQLGH